MVDIFFPFFQDQVKKRRFIADKYSCTTIFSFYQAVRGKMQTYYQSWWCALWSSASVFMTALYSLTTTNSLLPCTLYDTKLFVLYYKVYQNNIQLKFAVVWSTFFCFFRSWLYISSFYCLILSQILVHSACFSKFIPRSLTILFIYRFWKLSWISNFERCQKPN